MKLHTVRLQYIYELQNISANVPPTSDAITLWSRSAHILLANITSDWCCLHTFSFERKTLTNSFQELPLVFHTFNFCLLCFRESSLLLFCGSLSRSIHIFIFNFSCFIDACIAFAVTSCSNTLGSKFFFKILLSIRRGLHETTLLWALWNYPQYPPHWEKWASTLLAFQLSWQPLKDDSPHLHRNSGRLYNRASPRRRNW